MEVIYEVKYPYIKESDDSISGLVATPIIKALNSSNIEYILKRKPYKRQLLEIKTNKKNICAIGYFKTKNNQKYAKIFKNLYMKIKH